MDLLTVTELLGLVRMLGDVVKAIDEANTLVEHLIEKRIRVPRLDPPSD